MSDTTPLLSLPLLIPSQAQKHVTHNEALRTLDAVVQLSVKGRSSVTPPAAPEVGDRHIVPAGGTGAWAGSDGRVAQWGGESWIFHIPGAGWRAWIEEEEADCVWSGSAWTGMADRTLTVAALGVNAAADPTNRISVSSDASLFNHAGAGHQLKINKASAGATASLLFQSGYAGHAELGLAGSTDLSFKVSADGQSWREALRIDAASGTATGTAVQSNPSDATAGRLMGTGAFGLGSGAVLAKDVSALSGGGIYAYRSAEGSTGGPEGITSGQVWHALRDGEASQILLSANAVHIRTFNGGTWESWRRLDPESGTTATGSYLRLPDGTQICSTVISDVGAAWGTAIGSAFFTRAAPLAWVFPKPFTTSPVVTATVTFATDRRATGVSIQTATATSAGLQPWTSAAMVAADAKGVMCQAIGRWY